jgi:hypothetical protein
MAPKTLEKLRFYKSAAFPVSWHVHCNIKNLMTEKARLTAGADCAGENPAILYIKYLEGMVQWEGGSGCPEGFAGSCANRTN